MPMSTAGKVITFPWSVLVTAGSFLVEVLGIVLSPVLMVALALLELLFAVPILGRALRQIWSIGLEIVYRILGLFDLLLGAIGLRPEKKLRVAVVLLKDASGTPVVETTSVVEEIQAAIDIYSDQANVRVVPMSWFHLSSPFCSAGTADESWVAVPDGPSDSSVLDVSTNVAAWGEDLWMTGTRFHGLAAWIWKWGLPRRLLGYGAPVTVFVVRTIDGATGVSLGPLSDYITEVGTETADKTTIAHELGHACGLWHQGEGDNLMYSYDSNDRRKMTLFQALVVRNSRHVTYF